MRGALNGVLSLPEEQAKKGVVTFSGGNQAQALALSAKARNIPAWVVMPSTSMPVNEIFCTLKP